MSLGKIKKNKFYFFLTLGIIQVLYFIYAIKWGNIYIGDFKEYLFQADNLREHLNWYAGIYQEPINLDLYTRRPPLYGFFIFLVKSIYNSNYAIVFMQSVLSFINFYGLIKILQQYDFKLNVYKLILVFLIFYPSQFIYANCIMSEILFQTFLFWAFYNFVLFIKGKESRYIIFYNLLLACALLTKPVLYLFWIPNLILMIYLFTKDIKKYSVLISGMISLITVIIICFYNYKVTGYFHYSSLKHNNLFEFNANFILINKDGYEEAQRIMNEKKEYLDSIKDYAVRSSEMERIASLIIKENLFDYIKFHLKGISNFFFDPGRFDFSQFFRIESNDSGGIYYTYLSQGYSGVIKYILNLPFVFIFYLFCVMILNIIMVFSIINFIFEKRVEADIKIFLILLISYISIFSGIVGALRYKLPLLQIIFFTLPFFFERARNFFVNRKMNINSQNFSNNFN